MLDIPGNHDLWNGIILNPIVHHGARATYWPIEMVSWSWYTRTIPKRSFSQRTSKYPRSHPRRRRSFSPRPMGSSCAELRLDANPHDRIAAQRGRSRPHCRVPRSASRRLPACPTQDHGDLKLLGLSAAPQPAQPQQAVSVPRRTTSAACRRRAVERCVVDLDREGVLRERDRACPRRHGESRDGSARQWRDRADEHSTSRRAAGALSQAPRGA